MEFMQIFVHIFYIAHVPFLCAAHVLTGTPLVYNNVE